MTCQLVNGHSPISTARVRQVWHNNLPRSLLGSHLDRVFTRIDDVFEPPKAIFIEAKPSAYRRSVGVAKKSEVFGEEYVINLLGLVTQFPQREFGVSLRCR